MKPIFRNGLTALLVFSVVPIAILADDDPAPRTAAIREVFKPFETDIASLSPDGKHLAFERRLGDQLFLAIVDLSNNHVMELPLVTDVAAPLSGIIEKVPSRITFLKWPTNDRVVACVRGEVLVAVDADGRNFKRLLGSTELRDETRGLDKIPFGPRTLMVDSMTGQVLGSQSDRPVLLAPSGEPLNGDFASQFQMAGLGTSSTSRLGGDSDSVTMDVFEGSAREQTAPATGLRPQVLEMPVDDPEHLVVEIRGRVGPLDDVPVKDASKLHSTVLKVNIRTGATKGHVDEYFTTRILVDKQGTPRAALRLTGIDRTLYVAPKPGARLQPYPKVLGAAAAGFKVTPESLLGERSVPLGFDYNPSIFYYATNVGRDTYAIRAVDLEKQQDTGFVVEHPSLDFVTPSDVLPEHVLVFDRHLAKLAGIRIASLRPETLWIDRQLAQLQRAMEAQSKGMGVEILEWASDRSRFLVRVSDGADPGAFYIYDANAKRILEYARRAPSVTPDLHNPSKPFQFTTGSGTTLTGYYTSPRRVRLSPVPVIVYLHDGPWSRDMPGYDRGSQALAMMGFAVIQVNYRGSAGFGRAHMDALRRQGEKVALEDIVATLDWIQSREAVSKKRVALLGNGYGGYLALRAMQEFPDRFRCAVSINAPTNLARWMDDTGNAFSFNGGVREAYFGKAAATLTAASPALNGKPFKGPVLVVQAYNDQVVPERHAREIRRVLSGESEFLELLGEGHASWLPGTYVKVFDRLEAFFTTHIYRYRVDVGQEKEVVDEKRLKN